MEGNTKNLVRIGDDLARIQTKHLLKRSFRALLLDRPVQ
jgi:hypothetical protein